MQNVRAFCMLEGKILKYFIFIVTTLMIAQASASEMNWGFKSPAFHYGNGYSTHVLTVEQLQFNRQKDREDAARAEAERIER